MRAKCHRAKFKVFTDRYNIFHHIKEVSGNGDSFYRCCLFAVFDTETARREGKVTRNCICTCMHTFYRSDVDAVLDRLPTAKIVKEDDNGWIVSAEVFGTGIDMWLRSQGQYIQQPYFLQSPLQDLQQAVHNRSY